MAVSEAVFVCQIEQGWNSCICIKVLVAGLVCSNVKIAFFFSLSLCAVLVHAAMLSLHLYVCS